ncbi:dipeptidase [Fulvivirgaceae bacterium LMO-SS25]
MKKITHLFSALALGACLVSCGAEEQTTEQPEDLKAKAEELSKKFIITDGHIDIPFRLSMQRFRFNRTMDDISQRTEGGDFDYVRAKEGGLDAPFMSIYIPASYQETPGSAKAYADSLIVIVENLTQNHPDKFALAKTPEEVEANFAKGIISLPMGMENGAPIEDDLSNVEYFFDRGIRYITLTHGKDNKISDSSYDTTRTHGGLSEFGEDVVAEMNRLGIMVDVSHISDDAFYDVMELTKAPVIASHSSCRAFTPGFERNMSDEMLLELAKNDGVIQINFGSGFLDSVYIRRRDELRNMRFDYAEENGLAPGDSLVTAYMNNYLRENPNYSTVYVVADHIDHVKNLVGVDHVGLGSDYDGVGDSLPDGLKDVSEYPNLIEELLKRGYTEEEIEKICYKNVWRVWNKVIEVANAS